MKHHFYKNYHFTYGMEEYCFPILMHQRKMHKLQHSNDNISCQYCPIYNHFKQDCPTIILARRKFFGKACNSDRRQSSVTISMYSIEPENHFQINPNPTHFNRNPTRTRNRRNTIHIFLIQSIEKYSTTIPLIRILCF